MLGAYSRNPENVAKFAGEFGIKGYRSVDEALADSEVDVVSVLTPVRSHAPLALACLEAGKHVLVEKPVSHAIEEIQTLKAAAETAGRLCGSFQSLASKGIDRSTRPLPTRRSMSFPF